jgi:tyrosinase
MMRTTAANDEPQDMNYRNAAHSGPVFLPWHRKLLLEFEAELQKLDKTVTVPYWNWAATARLSNPRSAPIFGADFMGGDGTGPFNVVENGPFAGAAHNWPIAKELDPDEFGAALVRQFGVLTTSLPTDEHVHFAMRELFYDVPPLSASSSIGLRNRLEGWLNKRSDYRYWTDGSQMHNRVHVWVGGHMTSNTSPNDPLFWLNHCFVDKIWSDWQTSMIGSMPGMPMKASDFYVPVSGGPKGHNLDDKMWPWDVTPRDMLEPNMLGYGYDTDTAHKQSLLLMSVPVRRSSRRWSLD